MPSHRPSRASRVVKGTAALDPAPHRNRFRVKNTEKLALEDREKSLAHGTTGPLNIPWYEESRHEDIGLPLEPSHHCRKYTP